MMNEYDDEGLCEACGQVFWTIDLISCEGMTCCERCAREHASKLAEYHDDLDDDLRGS